jgi:hypothetical protein
LTSRSLLISSLVRTEPLVSTLLAPAQVILVSRSAT